jgi:hypothetical protein
MSRVIQLLLTVRSQFCIYQQYAGVLLLQNKRVTYNTFTVDSRFQFFICQQYADVVLLQILNVPLDASI